MIAQIPQPDRASYFARGQLFSSKGDYARAIADFDKVLSIAPNDQFAQQQRQAAVAMQAELAKVQGAATPAPVAPKEAVAAPSPAIPPATVPLATIPQGTLPKATNSASPTLSEAAQLMAQKKFADALPRLNTALALDPRNETALKLRVAANLSLSRFAEARTDIDALLKLKPNDSPLLASRSVASIGMKQLDQGTIDANQALSANPNNAVAYVCRGMASRLTGKFQDAIADFDHAISLNDKDYMAYSERGQAYMGLNQIDKAVVDFDRSLVLNPVNDTARASRGLVLLLKGNNAEGLVDVKNALDRNPNNQVAELGQGLAMLISGQYDRAIVALDQIVGKAPVFDAFVRTLRARAYLGKKDAAGAMTDLNLVLGTRPNDPDALSLRGIAFTSLKQYDKALDDLGKAIAQKPTIERYVARASVYEAKGNLDEATSDYRSATQMAPANVFDIAAQAQSRAKIQQLSKRTPCGNSGRGDKDDTCL